MAQQQLNEVTITTMEILEGRSPGELRVRGEFAKVDTPTQNKRVYGRKLYMREAARLQEAIKARRITGELDHPADGKKSLTRASHLITSLEVQSDGRVIGEAVVLDTAKGKDLAALLKAGCAVGISSRGYGSTKTDDAGNSIVEDDYRLETFDFVADPADVTAYPRIVSEGVEVPPIELTEHVEAAIVATEKQLREEFARKLPELLQRAIAGSSGPATEEVEEWKRKAGLYDGIVSLLSKDALAEEVQETKLNEAQKQIEELTEEREQLVRMVKNAGYKFYLDKRLASRDDRAAIEEELGDVSRFDGLESLKEAVGKIEDRFDARREALEQEQQRREEAMLEEVRKQRQKLEAELAARKEEMDRVLAEAKEQLDRREERLNRNAELLEQAAGEIEGSHQALVEKEASLEEKERQVQASRAKAKSAVVESYFNRRLQGRDDADNLRVAASRRVLESREDVDAFLHEQTKPVRRRGDASLRDRITKLLPKGRAVTSIMEETEGRRSDKFANIPAEDTPGVDPSELLSYMNQFSGR